MDEHERHLRERRLVLWNQARDLAELVARESRAFTPAEQHSWEGLYAQLSIIDGMIRQLTGDGDRPVRRQREPAVYVRRLSEAEMMRS